MNRFSVVLFAAIISSSLAEPPALSQSYGLPAISSGYSYQPAASHAHASAHSEYHEQHVGHQTSEGLHLDPHLLHKIEGVLVHHENSGRHISAPSQHYGAPQHTYGPPTHWSNSGRVVGIDFGHLSQSHQAAQYHALDRYAPSHQGWSAGNSGWNAGQSAGWTAASNSGWNAQAASHGWAAQSAASHGWAAQPVSHGWAAQSANQGWNVQSKPAAWTQQTAYIQPRAPVIVSSSPGWSLAAPQSSGWAIAKPALKYGAAHY